MELQASKGQGPNDSTCSVTYPDYCFVRDGIVAVAGGTMFVACDTMIIQWPPRFTSTRVKIPRRGGIGLPPGLRSSCGEILGGHPARVKKSSLRSEVGKSAARGKGHDELRRDRI